MWTLPSLPLRRPVGAAHVLGEDPPRLDAAGDVDAHVAVERRADVVRAHRRGDADRGGLVAAAGVERAGDLALPVEDVPALLDRARDQHVAVDAEQVLAVEARLPDLAQRADGLGSRAIAMPATVTTSLPVWARLGLAQEERRKAGDWVASACVRHWLASSRSAREARSAISGRRSRRRRLRASSQRATSSEMPRQDETAASTRARSAAAQIPRSARARLPASARVRLAPFAVECEAVRRPSATPELERVRRQDPARVRPGPRRCPARTSRDPRILIALNRITVTASSSATSRL